MTTDPARLLTAVAYIKTRFNINPRRVILGGYSSGGDLAYRTMFYHANAFAGCLIENSSPFRDTESTPAQSFAANAGGWRFNVIHLAHLQDEVYPIDGVRLETDAMISAGYPLVRIERTGTHYDSGTNDDLRALLLPHLNDAWLSP